MINILHIITTLPVGGVETTITRIVRNYSKTKFNPIICCLREGGQLAEKLSAEGYEVIVLNRMKSHRFDFFAVKALLNLIKKRDIAIVRTHGYHANLYGRLAAFLGRVPCIVASVHNVYTRDKKLHRRLLNHVLSYFTDGIVAVSNAVKKDIMIYDRIKGEKIFVIHNGIPLDNFKIAASQKKAREIFGLPPTLPLIGTVGRLVEAKGHRYLLAASSYLRNCGIVVAGDGPLRGQLEKYRDQSHVDIIFLGGVATHTVPLVLKAIDIFCFPSLWEGFGIALVEAMSSRLPIVASDIPPHREVMAHAGLYVPPRDPKQLADALNLLLENENMRESLAQQAYQRAQLFSIERTAQRYEALYEEILARKNISR